MTTTARGRWAERLAGEHLVRLGLRRVAGNWRGPHGEIDLVMRDGASLVFVEVRYRGPGSLARGIETIDRRKRQRLVDTAQRYLQRNVKGARTPCRFDVVDVSGPPQAPRIEWIRNAFEA